RTRTGRFTFLAAEQCLLAAQTENVAPEGVGRTGEVDTRDRHTCMKGINGDDGLIELEVPILVIDEGRPVGTYVGAAVRPNADRLWMQAPRAVAPVKTVVAEGLRAPIGTVDGA